MTMESRAQRMTVFFLIMMLFDDVERGSSCVHLCSFYLDLAPVLNKDARKHSPQLTISVTFHARLCHESRVLVVMADCTTPVAAAAAAATAAAAAAAAVPVSYTHLTLPTKA